MSTTAIAANTVASSSTARTDRGLGTLQSEDFFKLLVTELKQQDPLQPAKTSDMIGQVSQIRSIELSKQLTDTLGQLTQRQQTSGASDLLGKHVTAELKDDQGTVQVVAGIVTGVRFDSSGAAVLELDTGQTVPAEKVTRVQSPEAAAAQKNTAATGTTPASGAAGTTAASSAGTATSAAATGNTTAAKAVQKPRLLGGLIPGLSISGSFDL